MKEIDKSIGELMDVLNILEIPYNISVWNTVREDEGGDEFRTNSAATINLRALKVVFNKPFYFVEVLYRPYGCCSGDVRVYQCDSMDGIKPIIRQSGY